MDDVFGQLAFFDAELFRAVDDLVIDVGIIGNERDLITKGHKESPPRIEDDDGTEIPDMGIVINGRATDIKGHFAFLNGLEGFELST